MIVAPLTKVLPLTVSVNAASPAVALVGEIFEVTGTGLLTVKLIAGVDVPPPGAGFVTETDLTPPVAISDAAICVVNCVEFMKFVDG